MPNELLFQKGLSMNRLQTLVLVADKGSIAAAAGQDDLARQSQFSHQLKDLEICFGRKLTERKGRTLRLTPAGVRLASIMREHLLALTRFAGEDVNEDITVRIGAGESTINWLLIPNLRNPGAPFSRTQWCFSNMHAGEIKEQLLDQRLDFGIVRGLKETARLRQERLGILENRLFIPVSLLPGGTHPTPLAAISRLPLALLAGSSRIRQEIEKTCLRHNVEPHVRYECTTAIQLAAVVANHLAAGPLPELARTEFDPRKIVDIGIEAIVGKEEPLCLVWNPRTLAMSSKLGALKEMLVRGLSASLHSSRAFPRSSDKTA